MFLEADDLEFKQAAKLLLFLLLGVSLAFGLLTSRVPHPESPSTAAEPNQTPADTVSALSNTVHAKARMLSDLQHAVINYKAKHNDLSPAVKQAKRSLLYQLPPASLTPTANAEDPNQLNGLLQAVGPSVSQRVILKLKESHSSQSSFPSQSLASESDPFHLIRQHYDLSEVKKVFPAGLFNRPDRSLKTLQQQSFESPQYLGLDRLYSVQVKVPPDQTLDQFVDFCNQIPQVEYAEIDYPLVAHAFPNDPDFPLQWHLHNIGQDYPASGSYNPQPGLVDADIYAPVT